MKNQIPPFVHVAGQPYLVVSFTLSPPDDIPPLHKLLKGLLQHHAPSDILILRPLSRAEAHLLQEATEDATVEAWARMVVKDKDRLRARK